MASGSASDPASLAGIVLANARSVAWKYGVRGSVQGNVVCGFCGNTYSGGINRFKYHLACIVRRDCVPCPSVTEEAKREAIAELAALDEKKLERERVQAAIQQAIRPEMPADLDDDAETIVGSSRGPRIRKGRSGSTSSSSSKGINSFFVPRNRPGAQPSLEGTGWNKDMQEEADKACANFWYYNNLPFNVAKSPYWEYLVTALTVAGKGYKASSPKDLSGKLLKGAVSDATKILEEQKKQWQKYGCTILSDGWTDGKNRTLINFLAASNGEIVFLKSIDASNIIKNADNLSLMLEEIVLEVGIKNVVQVVTDNAAAYVAAGRLLQERHPSLFWTPCAAHCLDLLLEDIGKIDWVRPVIEDARSITKYIYNHPWVLNLMREHTKGKELVRAGVTRFATNFLTLQSICSSLTSLKQMFVSQAWIDSQYSKKVDGEKTAKIVFDDVFAKRATEIIKVIKGLDEGILSMKVGGKRRLYIPGPLAFPKGLSSAAGRPRVPPSSPVIFDVSLEFIPGLDDEEE